MDSNEWPDLSTAAKARKMSSNTKKDDKIQFEKDWIANNAAGDQEQVVGVVVHSPPQVTYSSLFKDSTTDDLKGAEGGSDQSSTKERAEMCPEASVGYQEHGEETSFSAKGTFEVGSSSAQPVEDESKSRISQSILIIGGYKDYTCVSDVESYHNDVLTSLAPMSVKRAQASAAKVKGGQIYVFGGTDDVISYLNWYDSVEFYDPLRNEWTTCSSLCQSKADMAGVCLNDKIYAIGGKYLRESFSEVEVFDSGERWSMCESHMQEKRACLAAIALNGAIYVAGGLDGQHCLSSTESYDPRTDSWTQLQNMSMKRKALSLAILNEKIYAIGGHDGQNTLSTVEVLDPRHGGWMMEEPMKENRAFSSAVVIGNSIYMIGGYDLKEKKCLDTVETYKEGHGWQVMDTKALGVRAFFCAFSADAV